MSEPERYVLDTHALYWYWREPARLGTAARNAFREIETERAHGVVPAIVVAELAYLGGKHGHPLSVARALDLIDRATAIHLEPMTRRYLLALDDLAEIPEMHDRIIAAVALVLDGVVVTRDLSIRASASVRSVW